MKLQVTDLVMGKGTKIKTVSGDVLADPAKAPSHYVFAAGTSGWGGGATSQALTVTGVTADDVVFAVLIASTNAVSVVKAVPSSNTVTVHFSADPGAATSIAYQVLRTL